jgi:hypothetical protein
VPDLFYHGPGLHLGLRAPLGKLAAITPRAGVDIPIVAGRMGDTEYRKQTGHFPLIGVLGALLAIYPSVFVVGLQADISVASITEDGSCTYVDTGDCANGGETQGDPSSTLVLGAHAGLVLGVAF